MKKMFVTLAIASLSVLSVARANTITENFSSDPLQNGWQIFGNTNLFAWDSTNQNLSVTWDSTQPNSYFYIPLGGYLTRNDDFSIAFDLKLNDIASNVEPGKTGPLQLGFGFLNFNPSYGTNATSTNFMRGSYGNAPDVAEFDYYPHGYYDYFGTIYDSPAATVPSFISGVDSTAYCPSYVAPFDNELPTDQWVHITFTYTATNQTAVAVVTTNGVPLVTNLLAIALTVGNGFKDSDDFHVDTFSISSYSSEGDYFDSVLAHGKVANLVVTLPPPAQNLAAVFSNGIAQVQFTDHLNWLYTLERTTNLVSWSAISEPIAGNGTNLFLQDTNAPTANGFYRVKAERP